jgi:peptidoglycan/LPS O-acetylase OafA/YrhL
MKEDKLNTGIFYTELESLRALAIIMVLLAHFIPKTSPYHIPFMYYGVDLFFTLSGFLITAILLRTKAAQTKSKGQMLKNFYVRRALRLFPIYYLFIFFFFLAKHLGNLHMWKDNYNVYFFSYFQNLYYFFQGSFNDQFSHLWSLAVEEQFYLAWPFLILFLSKKILPYLFLIIIFVSLGINTFLQDIPMIRVLTFSNLHTLGVGALLAYFTVHLPTQKHFTWLVSKRTVLTFILLPLMAIILLTQSYFGYAKPFIVELFLALTAVSLVLAATYGWQFGLGSIGKNKALMHIGKISYGIYLYHLPLPSLSRAVYLKITGHELYFAHELYNFLFFTTLTIILAHLSFNFIEKPFLKLKKKFK